MKNVLLAALLAVGASGQAAVLIDGIYYDIPNNFGGATVASNQYLLAYDNEDGRTVEGDIVIPASVSYNGASYNVTTLAQDSFYQTAITSIALPNTVTSIGKDSFWGVSTLKSVTFGEGIADLPSSLFKGSGITDLYFNGTVDPYAYSNTIPSDMRANINIHAATSTLRNKMYQSSYWSGYRAYILNNQEQIGDLYYQLNTNGEAMVMAPYAMLSKTGAPKNIGPDVDVPGVVTFNGQDYTVTSLEPGVFYDVNTVTNVTMNEGLRTIGYETFYGSQMTELTFPDSVETIEETNFYYCPKLESVTLGAGTQTIETGCFVGSNLLTSLTCKAVTPPALADFPEDLKPNIDLYVPAASVADYEAAPNWGGFKSIKPIITTGVESLEAEAVESTVRYFNLQGVELARPEAGVVIEIRGNKATKRVIR